MTDIVERLQNDESNEPYGERHQAADTITTLRAEVAKLREGLAMWERRYRAVPDWRLRPTSDDQDFVVALNTTRALLETNHD